MQYLYTSSSLFSTPSRHTIYPPIKIMDQSLWHLIQEVTSHKSLKKHAAKKGKCQYLFHVFRCLIKIVRLNISTLLCDEMIVNNGLRRIK